MVSAFSFVGYVLAVVGGIFLLIILYIVIGLICAGMPGLGLGVVMLDCPHCGRQTPSNRQECKQCGRSFRYPAAGVKT
jgi:hypothetical protein